MKNTRPLIKTLISLYFILIISLFFQSEIQAQNCSVNAGVSQTVCENEGLTLFGEATGNFLGSGDITWTQIDGPSAVIVDPNSLQTDVIGIVGGNDLTFRLSAQCQDGSLVFNDVVHTIAPISQADAGVDQSSCPGNGVITMNASTPQSGETGEWSFDGPNRGISIADINSPITTLNLSPNSAGTAKLVWTHSSPAGCITRDTVEITNCGGNSPVDALLGGDPNIVNLGACFSTTTSYRFNASFPGNGSCGQSGEWALVSGPNIPSINNPNHRRATISNLVEGTYVYRWIVSGPCASGESTITINVPSPVGEVSNANGTGGVFCEGITEVVLTGNAPSFSGETVEWTQIGGPSLPPGSIVSPNSPSTNIINLNGTSTYRFRYQITNAATGCLSRDDDVYIIYTAAPTIDAGPDQVLGCDITTAIISFVKTGTGTTQWQILSGPAGNPTYPSYPTSWQNAGGSPLSVPGLDTPGSYTILFRIIEAEGTGCETVYDDVVITSSNSPSAANAGSNQFLACNVDTTSMVGNDPSLTGGGMGTWYQVSGPGTAVIDNPHQNNTVVRNLINGAYVFRWLITGGSECPSTQDDVVIAVAETIPTQADAGPDSLVCFGTPFQLKGNATILNETGAWNADPSAGITFSDQNDPNSWVYGLQQSTVYTFTWTITNACGQTSDDVEITTTNIEGPIEAQAGPDDCYPSGTTTITLAGNVPDPSAGLWNPVSFPYTFSIVDPTDNNTDINITQDGTYILEWVLSYNDCTDSRDTVVITVSEPVIAADAGPDQEICGTQVTLSANTPNVGTGQWQQVIGPPGVTINSPNSNSTEVTGLIDGTFGFEWSVSNNACPGSKDTVLIRVSLPPDPADAGPYQLLCGSTSTNLEGNTITEGSGFWTLLSGPNNPSFNSSDPNTALGNLIMGSYIFTWTSQKPPYCPPSVDTVVITVVPLAAAGNDMEFCDTVSVELEGNPNSSGYWEQVILGTEPVITLDSTGSNRAIARNLLPGTGSTTFAFRYVIDFTGCSSADTVEITVYEQVSASAAGDDQFLCEESTFTFNADLPFSGSGLWTKVSGPAAGSIVDPADPNTNYTNADPGTYIFEWTVTNGACSNSDRVRIVNYRAPSAANAGPDQDYICDSATFMDAVTPQYGFGNWTQKSGPSTADIISPILPNTEVKGLVPGEYEFYWTVTNGPACEAELDSVMILVATTPTAPDAGPDQELCFTTKTFMAANTITTGTGTWSQQSGPNAANIVDANSPFTEINGLIPGTYMFYWTTETDSCDNVDSVRVVNHLLPTSSVAGVDTSICISSNLYLYANTPVTGEGLWTQLSGPAGAQFLDPDSPTTLVFGLSPGIYEFEWSITNATCPPSLDTVEVTIWGLPDLANAGPDQELCNASSTFLEGNDPSVGDGLWTQTAGPTTISFDDPTVHNTQITGLDSGTYTFDWTTTNGACSFTDEMEIVNYELPTTAITGDDQEWCHDVTSTTVTSDPVSVGNAQWLQASGPNTATIVSPLAIATDVTGLIDGTYAFVWIVENGVCEPSTDTLYITIGNCPPVAVNDSVYTIQETPVSGDVLPNDSDPENDGLLVDTTPLTDPVNGNITLNSDGTFEYTPDPGFFGMDSVQYVVCDDYTPSECDTAWIIITVYAAPVAVDDSDTTLMDVPVITSVLDNDFSPDANLDLTTLTIEAPGLIVPSNGSIFANPSTGEITYTPDPGFIGIDTYEYVICDDNPIPQCDTALVTIRVFGPPVAVDDFDTTFVNVPVEIDILDNDYSTDFEGDIDPATVDTTGLLPPSNGSLDIDPVTGEITYTPDDGFFGTDTFEYLVCDDLPYVQCDTALVTVIIHALDFGDAPDPGYPTISATDGARHILGSDVYLGTIVDLEPDGLASTNADGDDTDNTDDEDGITFTGPDDTGILYAGYSAIVSVTTNSGGLLNGWTDYNADGSWQSSEQIFDDVPLTAGTHDLVITVPADAAIGSTISRFRYSTQEGLEVTGLATDGEVEDYQVEISDQLAFDFGDTPDPTYPTLLANDGARHRNDPDTQSIYLGSLVDFDPDAYSSSLADGDDTQDGSDDEDGFTLFLPPYIGITNYALINAVGNGYLNVWIDYNADGDWNEPGEKVFDDLALTNGFHFLEFVIPGDTLSLEGELSFIRVRYSSEAGIGFNGLAADGEVEDYDITLINEGEFDFSDAPDTYGTTIASGIGAKHIIFPPVNLGALIDGETDGIPDVNAQGDDNDKLDDEDGIEFLTPLLLNQNAEIEAEVFGDAFLNAWIDLDANGIFEMDEQIIDDASLSTGIHNFQFFIPEDSFIGKTYMRFRYGPEGLYPVDSNNVPASYGEVEDYQVEIFGYEYGDAPEGVAAYPSLGITGSFPTCASCGPAGFIVHKNVDAYFGPSVDLEPDGNAGLCGPESGIPYNSDECFEDGDAGLIVPSPFTLQGNSFVACSGNGSELGMATDTVNWGIDLDILVVNTTGQEVYVNLLIDWNRSGEWSLDPATKLWFDVVLPEHILVNLPVPPGYNGPVSALMPPSFILPSTGGFHWARFSVTETPVPDNWDGSGDFEQGETEDYVLFVANYSAIPVSNWALFIALGLMVAFTAILWRRKMM